MALVLPKDTLLETADVANELDVHPSTVRRLDAAGVLEPVIVTRSGRRLYARFDVERVAEERRQARGGRDRV